MEDMNLKEFEKAMAGMKQVHTLTAEGDEEYSLYKHDVCYVERDGIKRTLQMIVPEMKKEGKKYPALLYVTHGLP